MSEIIYLDNAATSFPKPDVVHDTVRDFYSSTGVNPGRSGCDLALEAEEMIHGTRTLLSEFFNPSLTAAGKKKDPNRLVFTLNATMSLNLVINGTVGAGDHIVTTMMEHNSVIRPVNHKMKEGAEATYVVPDAEGYVSAESIRGAIRSNTKLVMVNHASNVTGVVQDLEAIGRVCKDEGVPLAVDSAQTAGVLDIDMNSCNIAFLSFTGHKCLFAPTGIGGICVADDAEIRTTMVGGTGVKSAYPYHLDEYPYRLEAGTLNLAGIAGLNAGVKWILEQGREKLYRHEMELLMKLENGLAEIPGVHVHGTRGPENRVATMSVTVDHYDASDVGTLLDVDYDVQTRTGLHCAPLAHEHYGTAPRGTVRFAVGPFNTEEHVARALEGMTAIAASRAGWKNEAV